AHIVAWPRHARLASHRNPIRRGGRSDPTRDPPASPGATDRTWLSVRFSRWPIRTANGSRATRVSECPGSSGNGYRRLGDSRTRVGGARDGRRRVTLIARILVAIIVVPVAAGLAFLLVFPGENKQ